MRNHERTSDFTSTIPNNNPATTYLKLYHHGCTNADSLIQAVSSERTSKSWFSATGISFVSITSFYRRRISGNTRLDTANPPAIKQTVATREGPCRLDNPIMACPDVQPPAYSVQKPTRNPPATINLSRFPRRRSR